jgi:hypothetical protein
MGVGAGSRAFQCLTCYQHTARKVKEKVCNHLDGFGYEFGVGSSRA